MSKPHAEENRLIENRKRSHNWQRWGPYLSERQWGTVREDYSEDQNAWAYFPHDHARSRAYRWGEDGLLGICDRQCRLCFSFAFWNTHDPILKERLFGLTGPEGNHGEDVKECYYYLDSTPTHSYMKALYKYPQSRFPYKDLVGQNRNRGYHEPEYELLDTGIFDQSRYFDCQIEYAKHSPNDILIQATITNRGPEPAPIHILAQWWYRNTWTWQCTHEGCGPKPRMMARDHAIHMEHESLGPWIVRVDRTSDDRLPSLLFTDNETNPLRHPDVPNTADRYYKDAFHEFLIDGNQDAVCSRLRGTKVAAHSTHMLDPGESALVRARMAHESECPDEWFGDSFEEIFSGRKEEADAFYEGKIPKLLDEGQKAVSRQAYAGLLWTKQFYHYVVSDWLDGDPGYGDSSASRQSGRNHQWRHLFNRDIISMPDKWEYPWYAAWDLAFHMIPMAQVDMDFAKSQMLLFLREWYLHPNGALPAYEWSLGDVNPPVHGWGAWEIYLQQQREGHADKQFLSRVFQKLLLNFTWWVNRKDPHGKNIFSGGFLGLDNIGVFDRSHPAPTGGHLVQADATAWMAFYAGTMLKMSLELAEANNAYEDMASKFFEHYLGIVDAANCMERHGLWDEEDGFYYDYLQLGEQTIPMKVRSLVGLMPLCTPVVLNERKINQLPGFKKRTQWFWTHQTDLARHMNYMTRRCEQGKEFGMLLLAMPNEQRLRQLLARMLDPEEFLSDFGIRSLSAIHRNHPFVFEMDHFRDQVAYVPGESESGLFGGNSNWRGPIWLPINYLLIQSLRTYHEYYGDNLKVECPTGSGTLMNLSEVAGELEKRLIRLFLSSGPKGRPSHGGHWIYREDPAWRDLILFYEYFHGDDGRGLGASHQTGWTSLVATMLQHAEEIG
jgi:hypothetical protein